MWGQEPAPRELGAKQSRQAAGQQSDAHTARSSSRIGDCGVAGGHRASPGRSEGHRAGVERSSPAQSGDRSRRSFAVCCARRERADGEPSAQRGRSHAGAASGARRQAFR